MKKLNMVILILTLMFVPSLYADEQSHHKAAEDFLLITKVDKQLNDQFERMKAIQKEQAKSAGLSESAIASQDKMMEMMASEMSWDKLKEEYISIYTEVFKEEELRGLADFYKSPLGQKYIDKIPELTSKAMQLSQKHTMQILPKIKALANEIADDAVKKAKRQTQPTTPTPQSTNREVK